MLKIGPYSFQSRLLLGTGKYPNFDIQKQAVTESESEILTFAVRRMNIFEANQPNFLEKLDTKNILYCQIQQEPKTQSRPSALQSLRKQPAFAI